MGNVKSHVGIWVQDSGSRYPPVEGRSQPVPSRPPALAAAAQNGPPKRTQMVPESSQHYDVARYGLIAVVTFHDLFQPLALPSTTSAGALASLFGRFTGTTAQSESSSAYMSGLWLLAFPDRPDRSGTLEVSRFSCCPEGTQFLGVPGVFDYAGPSPGSRSNAMGRCGLPADRKGSAPGS